MRVTFLGTGTSRGIPVIGCNCQVCCSPDPKNKRLRPSVLLESEVNVVIDTSVDFRQQMLRHRVQQLHAVVMTHPHVDHILGLDDVYPFNVWSRKRIPIYASQSTLKEIEITFRYLFSEKRYPGTPSLELVPIEGTFPIGDLQFLPVPVMHGTLPILGFRVGDFAYVTDVSYIPSASVEKLRGVRFLVLDGLRYKPHHSHFCLEEAVEAAQSLEAEKTYLTHICHDIEHGEGNSKLPESVRLAYDGLILEI